MLAKGDMAWRSSRKVLSACHAGRAVSAAHTTALLRATARRHSSSMSRGGAGAAAAAGASTAAPDSTTELPRVCILGGGFGGLYTAVKLQLLMWPKGKKPQITLVDQGERFIFKPLLYELLNGTAQSWEVAPTFAQLLAPYTIQFVQDKVTGVQPDTTLTDGGSASGGVVQLASGTTLPYDWLVVALGASADPRGVPGIKDNARPFNSLSDAEYLAGRLAAFEARAALAGEQQYGQQQQQQATIVIVGAGYAGVELAAVVGERMKGKASVVVVTPGSSILESAPAGQRQAAEEALRSLGVTVMTGTKVTGVERAGAAAAAAAAGAAASSAATAAAEAAMLATSTAAAAAAGTAAELPPRPQSPEAAAVDPLAVLAAAAAAASPTDTSTAAAGAPGSNGSAAAAAPSSTGEDATYTIQLEPVWASAGGDGSSSSSSMAADLVLWTAGARPASLPLQPFPLDPRGQLETDATLRVLKHSRVFALGDVSRGQPGNDGSSGSSGSSSGGFYPATAQVAFQQADYAAWNVWSAINGRALLPFRYQHLGDMMSLGASNAAVAFPFQLPTELTASISSSPLGSALALAGIKLTPGSEGLVLEGPLAQLLRRGAYLYRQPTNEQRLNVAASWIEQAVTTAARLAAELSASSSRDGSSRDGSSSWM